MDCKFHQNATDFKITNFDLKVTIILFSLNFQSKTYSDALIQLQKNVIWQAVKIPKFELLTLTDALHCRKVKMQAGKKTSFCFLHCKPAKKLIFQRDLKISLRLKPLNGKKTSFCLHSKPVKMCIEIAPIKASQRRPVKRQVSTSCKLHPPSPNVSVKLNISAGFENIRFHIFSLENCQKCLQIEMK